MQKDRRNAWVDMPASVEAAAALAEKHRRYRSVGALHFLPLPITTFGRVAPGALQGLADLCTWAVRPPSSRSPTPLAAAHSLAALRCRLEAALLHSVAERGLATFA